MTLHIFPDVVQGSDEWHEQRRGIVTASTVGKLITPSTIKTAQNVESRSLTAQLAAERITGYTEPTYVSDDMLLGHTIEPIVRDLYSKHWAPVTECGFMVRDFGAGDFRIGYSPDGLVGDDGLIETKSRRQKAHLMTILADEVPPENMAQLQCGLLVSGRDWVDYISYCGGMPLWRKRVEPDEKWQTAILEAVTEFEVAAGWMESDYHKAVEGLPETERLFEQEITI